MGNNQGMQQVVEDIKQSGGKAWGYYCDIGNKEDVYRTAKTVEIEVGKVYSICCTLLVGTKK